LSEANKSSVFFKIAETDGLYLLCNGNCCNIKGGCWMAKLTFYTYPSCTSCRKTKSWLNDHQIDFEERHLFRETPNVEELMEIISLTTDGLSEILATRSETFKKLNLNLEDMRLSEVLKILCDEPKLLRRPIITDGSRLVVGYNQPGLIRLADSPREENTNQVSSF
jgi:Spx/MgsR family transcriptional regulator